MLRRAPLAALLVVVLGGWPSTLHGQDRPFERMDVFDLEWVEDPGISPDGEWIVYVRRGMDIMEDRRTSALWLIRPDGSDHMKLTSRDEDESSPRWSPDGSRVAFASSTEESGTEIFVHMVDRGNTTRLTRTDGSPGSPSWSPDGEYIAFSKRVEEDPPSLVSPPDAPEDADWADPPRVEDRLNHELDGVGTLDYGFDHLFVVRAEGGTVRQVTSGEFHHSSRPEWTPDGERLVFSANRREDWEHERNDTELYSVPADGGGIVQLTERYGPTHSPRVSPDGATVAYLGHEDRVQTYQIDHLHTVGVDGEEAGMVETDLDRSINDLVWDEDGEGLYIQYDDQGDGKLGHVALDGTVTEVTGGLGGTSVGRPYAGSADFSVANDGTIVLNRTSTSRPAELAVTARDRDDSERITDLNGELLDRRALGEVEEVRYTSSEDGLDLHGWVITPTDTEPGEPSPLVVELHGGPISHYGPHFSPELQLYASAGYAVFYPNYRGSTSYGEAFGNELYHAFSGAEYPDIMDGVDHVIEEGYAHPDSLYITGGSAGGTSTAWAVGRTDRFRAAVVQKPVINWISKTLAADNWYGYAESRYPGWAWENPVEYWEVSPISLAGEIETPTMLIVGDLDLRTPTWEARQLYHALRQRDVETIYVEMPGAYHSIANRPSQLIAKVDHVLAWFEEYR